MKTKAEEKKQFKLFLGRLEPGGYLDNMFSSMLHWVERQITDDHGVDVMSIIDDFYKLTGIKAEQEGATKRIQELVTNLDNVNQERDDLAEQVEVLTRRMKDQKDSGDEREEILTTYRDNSAKALAMVEELREKYQKLCLKENEQERVIEKLKAKLYDSTEEINGMKKLIVGMRKEIENLNFDLNQATKKEN